MKLTDLELIVLQKISRGESLSSMFAGNTRPVSQACRRLERKGALTSWGYGVPSQGFVTEAGKLYLAGKDPRRPA